MISGSDEKEDDERKARKAAAAAAAAAEGERGERQGGSIPRRVPEAEGTAVVRGRVGSELV